MTTKKAPTIHGEIEYETVECASCGEEIAKETANKFVIGEDHGKQTWHHQPYTEYHIGRAQTGWACEYCRNQPIDYPAGFRKYNESDLLFGLTVGISLGIIVGLLITVIF